MADIIIVDDDPAVLSTMRKTLERADHTVRQAANGKEGIRLFRRRSPDLVVSELFMPVKNGIAMIRELREETDVKILAISGGSPLGGGGQPPRRRQEPGGRRHAGQTLHDGRAPGGG